MPARSPLFIPKGLPPLTAEASVRVEEMVMVLRDRMVNAGGSISFADYMEKVLYTPGCGYYTGGLRKFGHDGDFVTAPEISPLFGRCLARSVAAILALMANGEILEVGAGSGALAVDILEALDALGISPHRYLILEISSELRIRQAETLSARIPQWMHRIEWCNNFPDMGWEGVVIANEFLDALPVYRFEMTAQQIMEQQVGWDGNGFEWRLLPPAEYLTSALDSWQTDYGEGIEVGYISELALEAPAWLTTLASRLGRGGVLFIDYGYPGREYYHPQRSYGTLACHYRHHRHDDPLILPGLQDITAHVNFTAIAEAAVAAGLTVAGYTTQANFLISTGIAEIFAQSSTDDVKAQLSLANQVRRLTLPQEMGELFKVLMVTRGLNQLLGFQNYDQRNRL